MILRILFSLLLITSASVAQHPIFLKLNGVNKSLYKRPPVAGERLIAIYGQSNTGMKEDIANLQSDLLTPIPNNYIYNFNIPNPAWETLTTSNNEGDNANTHTNTFGIEFRLMKLMHDTYGGNQYLLKFAQSSTQLASTGNTTLDWNVSSSSVGNPLELFDLCILNRIYARSKIPVDLDVSWVIWIQGENDAGNSTLYNAYQTNLTNWINTYRTQTGLGTNVKFILVSLSTGQTAVNGAGITAIKTAMSNIAGSLTNVFYFSQNQSTSDGTHYDAAAIDFIANGVFNIISSN